MCIPAASKNAILKESPLFKKGFQANLNRSISTEYDIILSIVLCVSGLMSIVALDRVWIRFPIFYICCNNVELRYKKKQQQQHTLAHKPENKTKYLVWNGNKTKSSIFLNPQMNEKRTLLLFFAAKKGSAVPMKHTINKRQRIEWRGRSKKKHKTKMVVEH